MDIDVNPIFAELEKLRSNHYSCEDEWYSCPKSEDYIPHNGIMPKSECDCGADMKNKIIDDIIKYLKGATK